MRNRGFTIIELLIVIAVITILVGLALPRFKGMQDEGNIVKAKGELRTLQSAVESCYIHSGNTYPPALSNLTSQTPQLVATLPTDPFNVGSDYGYAVTTNGKYYVIYSVGPAGGGSATIAASGTITETNGTSCIYASNAGSDSQP
ncbi:MAG: type II secretion system protein [Candidatus Omnitrophota bacterium]